MKEHLLIKIPNQQLFASKYRLYLPTEEELKLEIDRQKELLEKL